MGIYLPNIEMPKDKEMLCVNIYPDGKVCISLDLECKRITTAVAVPPHGRLVDLDEFLNRAFGTGLFNEDDMRLLQELVGESSIVIPAEEDVT